MNTTTVSRSVRRSLLLLLALAPAGCTNPFNTTDFLTWEPDPGRIHDIDRMSFVERSRSAPVPVDVISDMSDEELDARIRERLRAAASMPSVGMSLEEVRATALEHNLDLQVQLLNPAQTQAQVDAEEAKFESVFSLSAQRSRTDRAAILQTEASKATTDRYSAGVTIPLRTGGTATVNFPFSETETNNIFSNLNPAYRADLQFSISQPLLRNAGNRVNTHSIRVQRTQHFITSARTKLEAIRILANADRAYWRLYAAQEELKVRQQQYELAMTQLDRARRRVEAGDVAEIEIIRAQSGVSQRLEAIIIADTNVKRARRDLKRILNQPDLPMDSATRFDLASAPDPLGLDLDADELADFALANRMEMLELELQLAIDASAIDFQRNQKLPLITLDYRYIPNGLGTTYNNAFDQVVDHSFEDWSLGINADIPLGNEAALARLHQAVLARVQRLATREQREASIRQEVYDAVDQLQQNWQRILAARQDAMLAGRTYEAEQRQFEVGTRTSTDVLDAATRLADAQSAEIRALSDYQIAQVDLAFATGTLLGYEKVRWEPIDVPYERGTFFTQSR